MKEQPQKKKGGSKINGNKRKWIVGIAALVIILASIGIIYSIDRKNQAEETNNSELLNVPEEPQEDINNIPERDVEEQPVEDYSGDGNVNTDEFYMNDTSATSQEKEI